MFENQIETLRKSVEKLKASGQKYCMMLREQAEFLGVTCFHEGQRQSLEPGYKPEPGVISMVKVKVYDLYVVLKGEIHGVDYEDPDKGQGGDSSEALD